MIKHLRFFMLNLLVLVSAAVMAQTRVVFSDGLPSDWTKTGTVAKQTYAGKPWSGNGRLRKSAEM